jgi:hypothetical protein
MAEGFLRDLAGGRFEVVSAGMTRRRSNLRKKEKRPFAAHATKSAGARLTLSVKTLERQTQWN